MSTILKSRSDISQPDLRQPLPIVSADSHIGPRLVEDLRTYCPKELLDDFDAYAKETYETLARAPEGGFFGSRQSPAFVAQLKENLKTAGHYDMATRLQDMNRDGVTAEVIFHGSQNDQPV